MYKFAPLLAFTLEYNMRSDLLGFNMNYYFLPFSSYWKDLRTQLCVLSAVVLLLSSLPGVLFDLAALLPCLYS